MSFAAGRRVLIAVSVCVCTWLAVTAPAASQEGRGIDPNQGQSLVEVNLPSKAAAKRLQLKGESYGVDFNEHYLRHNADGSVTATVFGTEQSFAPLDVGGYDLGRTIEGPDTWRARIAARQAEVKCRGAPRRRRRVGRAHRTVQSHEDEIVVLRVDYFENYAGRFLSVEAKDRLGGVDAHRLHVHRADAVPLLEQRGRERRSTPTPRPMGVNIDPDTTPDTYIEHRELVRIGEVGEADAAAADPHPDRLEHRRRSKEADVNIWLGGGLPPMASRLPEGLHDSLHGPDRGLRAFRGSSPPSSRTSAS